MSVRLIERTALELRANTSDTSNVQSVQHDHPAINCHTIRLCYTTVFGPLAQTDTFTQQHGVRKKTQELPPDTHERCKYNMLRRFCDAWKGPTFNLVPAHKPHSPAVIQRLALLSSEASHRPEYFSSRNINIADVAAAKTLQRSPTLGGVPSEESSTVPTKARSALTQVGMEILLPSSTNAKNGTNLTLRYSKNALRLVDGRRHTCGCGEGDGAAQASYQFGCVVLSSRQGACVAMYSIT